MAKRDYARKTVGKRKQPANTSVTPGGLIRKSYYVTLIEYEAIREHCFKHDIKETELIRRSFRRYLGMKEVEDNA